MILDATRVVTPANGPRPAGSPDVCFYCGRLLGMDHDAECVLYKKTVVVRASVEYVIRVPAFWDAERVNFHRNESTWCANNGVRELLKKRRANGGAMGCWCGLVTYEYVREATAQDGDADAD